MALSVQPIPAAVAGTVPVASRREFLAPGTGTRRFNQIAIRATEDPAAYTQYVATLEGSFDRQTWFNFAPAALNPNPGVTLDESGVTMSADQAEAGVVLTYDVSFPHLRLGLAGIGAVGPGGEGVIEYRSTRV